MKPSYFLADALDKAASLIEEEIEDFNWYYPESCNLGYLARAITGKSKAQIYAINRYCREELQVGCYSNAAKYFLNANTCHVSGYSIPELLRILVEAGLEKEDFDYLEDYQTREGNFTYNQPDVVISFFKEEARKMREQLQQTVTVTQKEKVETVTQIVRGF